MIELEEMTGQRIFKDIFGVEHTEVWFLNEESCSCGWGRQWNVNGFSYVTYEAVPYDRAPLRCPPEMRGET